MYKEKRMYSFYNPVNITFGAGSLERLPMLIKGQRALLITTQGFSKRGLVHELQRILKGKSIMVMDQVTPNPDLKEIEEGLQNIEKAPFDVIVALGGGSVLDMAKVYRYLPHLDPLSLRRHLEEDAPLSSASLIPMVAIPTTAGTGSEVTPFATIWDQEKRKKYSLSSQGLYPTYALLDPLLTLSLPEEITVSSGLDALSHALESIWNIHQNPMALLYAKRAVKLLLQNIEMATKDPHNLMARTNMMEASLLAGVAISSTRTALAHSISYPLTMHFGLPHGLACSFALPAILDYNSEVGEGPIHSLATSLGYESPCSLKEALQNLFFQLRVKERIEKYIPSLEDLPSLGEEMLARGRLENNLRQVKAEDIEEILRRAREDLILL